MISFIKDCYCNNRQFDNSVDEKLGVKYMIWFIFGYKYNTNLGIGKFFLVLVFFLVIFLPQWANAQDLSSIETTRSGIPKLDSSLASLYELYQQEGNIIEFAASSGLFNQGNNVRVIIELSSATSTLPQNLGINVETSYETSIQAMVPISNLESISSLDEVKFVRAPIIVVVDQTIQESETQDDLSLLAFLAIIPAAVIAIVYYKKRRWDETF